jgi:hypothetical protein
MRDTWREANQLHKVTKHHVPPQHPDPQPRFIRKVDNEFHRAYHLLFQAAATYEDACEILKRDWWTKPAEQNYAHVGKTTIKYRNI